jgi:hypothetical protein
MNKPVCLCGAALIFAAGTMSASAAMKPGLWDYSTTMNMANAPQIPPEALAAMQARGIQIPGMGAPIKSQICLTPAQAARNAPPTGRAGCTNQNVKQTGNTVSGDIVCNAPDMQATGHFDATFVSDGELRTKMTMKGTSAGRPMDMAMETQGVWRATDCGTVKPFAD